MKKRVLLFLILLISSRAEAQVIRNNTVQIAPITFVGNSATLAPAADSGLQQLRRYLTEKPYVSLLRIEGHVGSGGDAQHLSEQRALAVCQWLTANGIDCGRLAAVGFGSTKPAGTDAVQNTRIVAANAALRGHAIGGLPADGGGRNAGRVCP